jgi:hypothetical protein
VAKEDKKFRREAKRRRMTEDQVLAQIAILFGDDEDRHKRITKKMKADAPLPPTRKKRPPRKKPNPKPLKRGK